MGKGVKYVEKEKKANIWRRNSRKILGEGKYLVRGGDKEWRRKRRKNLEKENIWSEKEKKNGEGRGGEYLGEGKGWWTDRQTDSTY